MEVVRFLVKVQGTVQGVGFRPYVFRKAKFFDLKGRVYNSTEGLILDIEGLRERINLFINLLRSSPPPLARIENLEVKEVPPKNYPDLEIVESKEEMERKALIPPDVATCEECKFDIFNPEDRRYMYPFTNCTNCGPRFTIVQKLPYDRENTSMAKFEMCEECKREYHDPENRRFHAQPICCPKCGPNLYVLDRDGRVVSGMDSYLDFIWERLSEGKIIALKGLGGFHLCCDAKNEETIRVLRERKRRPKKPLAVMMRDIETVKRYCFVNEHEERFLLSVYSPIVALRKRHDFSLPANLSPGMKTLGVMLPYTPLHTLILSGPFEVLVMTSGNYSELPIAIDNEEALTQLNRIADFFLVHERDIVNRCDDSVLKVLDGKPHFYRLSRGFVPTPIDLPLGAEPYSILGIGGEMKNNFCIVKGKKAFMSQYIGELDEEEGIENLKRGISNLERLLGVKVDVVAYDMHPHYQSSNFAKSIPAKKAFPCQHHHAHMVSCMVDAGLKDEEVIGIVLDGTGYGDDGNLWGFEILRGNFKDYQRLFHLAYVPLPGGEVAIREPWRVSVSYVLTFLGDDSVLEIERIFGKDRVNEVREVLKSRINCPLSSGCGRLFDAVSALLGMCERISYEGEAAIALGELISDLEVEEGKTYGLYGYSISSGEIIPDGIVKGVILDLKDGLEKEVISAKFHNTIIRILEECVERIGLSSGLRRVVLSGGTFHNDYLLRGIKMRLKERGYEVFSHERVPTNDGGISLGQVAIAVRRLKEG